MSLLVRKVQRGKWRCLDDVSSPVNADALTNCLKTTDDTLSVWFADNEEDLVNAKIALIGTMSKLETINIVILNGDELVANNIVLSATPGLTVAKPLIERHRDLSKLSIVEMGVVSGIVQRKMINNEVTRLGKKELTELFQKALATGVILKDDLSEDLRTSLFKN